MAQISSTKNPLIKRLKGLADRPRRDAEGRMVVEGVRLVEEVLAAGIATDLVLVDPDARRRDPRLAALVDRAAASGIRAVEATAHVIGAVSQVETPQGILAVVVPPSASLEPVLEAPDLLLLVADRIRDPGNLGAIVRVADAARASAVAVTRGSADPHNPKAVRATMGSLFHLPVVEVEAAHLAAELRRRGVRMLLADPRGAVDYTAVSYAPPLAVVCGGEAAGADPLWAQAAEATVRIPLYGRAESLNVAIAAALVLYEARRAASTSATATT